MRQSILALGALLAAGCNPSAEPAADTAVTNTEPARKRPTYCFFKDADAKGWAAARDSAGEITVTGEAHMADRRYRPTLGEAETEGGTARLWLTMAPNTTGSGSPGDWWEVSAKVPDSAAVTSVTVLCGKKTVAELALKKG